jgi:hypothetical protein
MAGSDKAVNRLDKEFAELDPPYRILAMDAGGIYGTFTAIMLRKLCERDENFLKDDQITLFAGSSAGAINALILANEENPRDAALKERKLEKFFKDSRVYSNRKNPVAGALSLVGLASWSGKADFYAVLEDYFGDMKMKDLKHRVMVTAFNLRGDPEDVFGEREWQPRIFYNFPAGEADRELFVKDVAYGAASPPTLRPVRNGITDGGFFASDPTAFAIAKMVSTARNPHPLVDSFHRIGKSFTQQQPVGDFIAYLLSPRGQYSVVNRLTEMLESEPQMQISVEHRDQLKDRKKELEPGGDYEGYRKELDKSYDAFKVERSSKHDGKSTRNKLGVFEILAALTTEGQDKQQNLLKLANSSRKLARWEVTFWGTLIRIMEKAKDLSADEINAEVQRPKQILELLDNEIKELEDTLLEPQDPENREKERKAKDLKDVDMEKLQTLLQRGELMRKLLFDELEGLRPEDLLQHISVLSVGLGAKRPNYMLENFDYGPLQFLSLPTNFSDKFFSSPLTSFLANPAKDTTRFQAKSLLGEEDYFRLDPPIIGFPVPSVTSAAYLARNPLVREYILKKFYEIADSKAVEEQILKAGDWKKKAGWLQKAKGVAA